MMANHGIGEVLMALNNKVDAMASSSGTSMPIHEDWERETADGKTDLSFDDWFAANNPSSGIEEAPKDGKQYVRMDGAWSESENAANLLEAWERETTDGTTSLPFADWLKENVEFGISDAPHNGKQYARQDGSWSEVEVPAASATGIDEAPQDGKQYARQDGEWSKITTSSSGGGIPEAPEDGKEYVRKDGEWVQPTTSIPSGSMEYLTNATWVDGRPIYRKTFTGTTGAATNTEVTLGTIAEPDGRFTGTVVGIQGFAKRHVTQDHIPIDTSANVTMLNGTVGSQVTKTRVDGNGNVNFSHLQAAAGDTLLDSAEVHVTVEYVKGEGYKYFNYDFNRFISNYVDTSLTVTPTFLSGAPTGKPVSQSAHHSFLGGTLTLDGRVVFSPYSSSEVGLFDPTTDTYTNGAAHGKGANAFTGACTLPDGRVVFAPQGSDAIGLYYPDTNKFVSAATKIGSEQFGGVCIPDGRVVFAPGKGSPNVLIYDPATNKCRAGAAHGQGGQAFTGTVLLPDGKVLFVPFDAGSIGIYDPVEDSIVLASVNNTAGAKFVSGVILPDGRVLLIPRSSPAFGIYNPDDNSYTVKAAHNKGGNAFTGGVLAPDGRTVICEPYYSNAVGKYDIATDTYSDIAVHGKRQSAFEGSVALPDGRIVLVPCKSDAVGIVHLGLPVPQGLDMEFYTSPYKGRY